MPSYQSDVVILGAGAAGIAAAVELSVAGARINVVEARDRIGGRILTVQGAAPFPLELGAEYLHGKEKYLWNLMEHYQFRLAETDGSNWHRTSLGLRYDEEYYSSMDACMAILLEEAAQPGDMSLADFASQLRHARPELETSIRNTVIFIEDYTAAPATETSIKFIARGELASHTVGQIPLRPLDGYIEILNKLSAPYVRPENLFLETAVKTIEWSRSNVFITAEKAGEVVEFEARKALITLPVGVLKLNPRDKGAVSFSPPLVHKVEALEGLGMGQASRIVAVFKRRFWSDLPVVPEGPANFRQFGFVHCEGAPIPHWWSQYPVFSHQLIGWKVGPTQPALSGKDKGALRLAVVSSLAQIFEMMPASIEDYLADVYTHDWNNDSLSKGIYSYSRPGMSHAHAILAAPVEDTLFFAGEATEKTGFSGTVHGALRSGFRAAAEILGVGP